MLRKVSLIRDIGRFGEFKHKATDLKRLSFIYALNAHGKSTLCAVLRSAASADPRLILERVRLGAGSAPTVTTSWEGVGEVNYVSGKWSARTPRVQIFDSEFVRRNIHVGEEVTRDNKRSLLRVIVGASGVALAEAINKTDDEIDQVNKELQECDRAIRTAYPAITDIESFCARTIPDDVDTQIVTLTREATAAKAGSDISLRPIPQPIPLTDETWASVSEVFAATGKITPSIDDLVRSHLAKHDMESRGRAWLRFGVEHAADDCPFCDQSLSTSAIYPALQAYFSDELKAVAERVDTLVPTLSPLSQNGPGNLRRIVQTNTSVLAFWQTVIETPPLDEWTEDDAILVEKALASTLSALERKRSNPFDTSVDTLLEQISMKQAAEKISAYNNSVRACLERIQRAKERPIQTDVIAAERSVATMTALAARRDGALKKLVDDRNRLSQTKSTLTKKKDADKKALKTNLADMARENESDINKLLGLFGATFTLCDTKASYVGRDPNSEYCLDISGQVLKVGATPKTPEPSFKTVLSAGDKSALALAFFVARVLADPKIAETTVIFDDPFSSQDHFRQVETGRQLRLIAERAKQVIVFSHDIRFIERTYRDTVKNDTSIHQIIVEGHGKLALRDCNIDDEMKVMYVRRADRIRLYASTGVKPDDCSITEIQTDLRSFLEEYVDLRNPGRFGKLVMLDGMADEIENAGPSDPLHPYCADLRAINEYSRPDHHKGSEVPDPIQLRAKCQQVINIIGSY